jgi:hypothetical protein
MLFSHSGFYCVVAKAGGRIAGSNCLDERSTIAGVGPITIDPDVQNRGIGRKLMQAMLDRARKQGSPGMRLVQAAFHNRSLSLYASLGFDIREPLSCMQGRTLQRSVPGCAVRAAQTTDIEACNAVARDASSLAFFWPRDGRNQCLTLYNWRAKYSGPDVNEARRLRALEEDCAATTS